jgi:hypothetical protein
MSLADRLEGLLQRGIEGLFGRRSGGVQPVEVGRRLARLMEEKKQVSVSAVYAPNAFVVELSPPDHALLGSIAPRLSEELVHHLSRIAQRQGFSLVGPLTVTWLEAEQLAAGVFRTEASFVPSEPGGQVAPPAEGGEAGGPRESKEHTMVFRRPHGWGGPAQSGEEPGGRAAGGTRSVGGSALTVVRGPDAGRTLRLRPGENRVGRAEDNDLVLGDTNVSRYHAVITWDGGRARVQDLGSRNGTRRNGEPVGEADLAEGDELQVGLDVLSFRER